MNDKNQAAGQPQETTSEGILKSDPSQGSTAAGSREGWPQTSVENKEGGVLDNEGYHPDSPDPEQSPDVAQERTREGGE